MEQIVDEVLELPERQRLQILAPIVRKKKGQHKTIFEKIQKDGYVRVRVNGDVYDVSEVPELSKSKAHNIEVVVDRIVIKEGIRSAFRFYRSGPADCGRLCHHRHHG